MIKIDKEHVWLSRRQIVCDLQIEGTLFSSEAISPIICHMDLLSTDEK